MSLKGKFAAFATAKIAEKVVSKENINNAISSAVTKIMEAAGIQSTADCANQIETNYLIVKARSYSLGTVMEIMTGKDPDISSSPVRYQMLDSTGETKYTIKAENTATNRDVLALLDARKHKLGYVKEHLIPMGVPLFEKEVKKCSVYIGEEKIAELKKFVSFGDLYFEDFEGNVEIKHNKGEDFRIYYGKKLIASLHDVPMTFKEGFEDKYVIEYDDVADEIVAVLLVVALDIINR